MGTVKEEHVMRCEVTGGFVEVRYVHDMSAEDVVDLILHLDVLRSHLIKRADQCRVSRSDMRTTGYIPVCLNCSDSSITVNDDGLCAECDDIRRGGAGEESR